MPETPRVKHPGFRWMTGPTTHYTKPLAPFYWVRYATPDGDGMCGRTFGFADTPDAARAAAMGEEDEG
jgi:hypothetical protein